jgi:hypothetical protein
MKNMEIENRDSGVFFKYSIHRHWEVDVYLMEYWGIKSDYWFIIDLNEKWKLKPSI